MFIDNKNPSCQSQDPKGEDLIMGIELKEIST